MVPKYATVVLKGVTTKVYLARAQGRNFIRHVRTRFLRRETAACKTPLWRNVRISSSQAMHEWGMRTRQDLAPVCKGDSGKCQMFWENGGVIRL